MAVKHISTGTKGPLKAAKGEAVRAMLKQHAAAGFVETPDTPIHGVKLAPGEKLLNKTRKFQITVRRAPVVTEFLKKFAQKQKRHVIG